MTQKKFNKHGIQKKNKEILPEWRPEAEENILYSTKHSFVI